MYPNPVQSQLTVEGAEFQRVDIFDLQGRLVRSFEVRLEKEVLDLGGLAEGAYVVRVGSLNHGFNGFLDFTVFLAR